jgi:isopenicillin N synthase-like dioxygenase
MTQRDSGTAQSVRTGNGPRSIADTGIDPVRLPFDRLPVIDLAPIFGSDPAATAQMAAELRAACTQVGFFYLRNHRVPRTVIDAAFAAAHGYFALDAGTKERNHVSRSRNNRGYAALLEENTDPNARGDLHESFDIALELGEDDPDVRAGKRLYGPNQWPAGQPDFRAALLAYHGAMLALSGHLLHAFAHALDLDPGYFDGHFTKPLATLRVLHYPPQTGPIDERQIGIGAHSDYECFTILAQDRVAALQVLNTDGQWVQAPPLEDCFVVNIGDQMARWTNDRFASTVHRAINRSGLERYSIPFFFGPDYDTVVEALPGCTGPDRPARYAPVTSGAYVNSRFAETFAHYENNPGESNPGEKNPGG